MTDKVALKIVLLIPKLNVSGGVEKIITEYANWLRRKTDSDVTVVKLNTGENAYKFDKGVRVIEYGSRKSGKLRNIVGRLIFCKRVFRELDPDVIYCTYTKPIMFTKLTKPRHSRIIGSEHSIPKYRGPVEERLRYFASLFCDGFIFPTNDVRKDYPKRIQKRSTVIPNAAYITQATNNIKKQNLLLAMGRLEKVKAFDESIRACAPILKKYPTHKLKILGEGSERANLESLIRELGLEKQISLPGKIEHPETEIAKAKVFILTSRYEGFSNALVESMSAGTCCIAYDCDYGPRNIIDDGKNGILVPPGDAKLLGQAIESVITDDKKRMQFEKNAKEKSTMYSVGNIFNLYYKYFKQVGGK